MAAQIAARLRLWGHCWFALVWFGLVSRIAYAKCKNLFCVIKREHDYDCNAARGMRVACATCGVCATPNERHVRHVRPLPPGRHTQSESTSPAGHRSQGQSVSQAKLICCAAASGKWQLQLATEPACGMRQNKSANEINTKST